MSNQAMFENKQVISTAQILNLNSVPVLIIPGQAGCVIDMISIYFRYIAGTTPFNPGISDLIQLFSGSPEANALLNFSSVVTTGFIDQSTDQSAWGAATLTGINLTTPQAVPLSSVEGQGVYLTQWNSSDSFPTGANWSTGNGSLVVFCSWSYLRVL